MRAKYLLFLLPDIDVTDKSIQLRAKFFFNSLLIIITLYFIGLNKRLTQNDELEIATVLYSTTPITTNLLQNGILHFVFTLSQSS